MCPCCLLLCAERRCCPRCRCAQEPAREEGRPEGISHCSSVPFACCSGTAAAAAAILLAVTAAASQFEPLCSCVWSGAGNSRWLKHLQVVLGHRLWQRPAEGYPVSEQQQQIPATHPIHIAIHCEEDDECNEPLAQITSFDRNPNHFHRYRSQNGSLKRRFRNHLEVYAPD